MSKVKKAVVVLTQLLRGIVERPMLSATTTKMLPFSTRGTKFGREIAYDESPLDDEDPPVQNPLTSYFMSHTEGLGISKWMHYFDIYHRHFNKFVGQEIHVLEIGVYSGGSLRMWKEYFGDKARIYGVDIEGACKAYEDERTTIFIGDQGDRNFWQSVKSSMPLVDIIIDDGGHLPEQQIVSLEEMLPHLRPGGIYLCEDIHRNFNRFAAYMHGLAENLNTEVPFAGEHEFPTYVPSGFQMMINSIHLYPFVAVIEKNKHPLRQLVARKQGTRWQQFL